MFEQVNIEDMKPVNLRGHVNATLDELIQLLGRPEIGDLDSTTVEWRVIHDDHTHIKVYDWKQGEHPANVTHWNVAANNTEAVDILNHALARNRELAI